MYHQQEQSTRAHSSLKLLMQAPVLSGGFGTALGTLSPEYMRDTSLSNGGVPALAVLQFYY